MNQLIILWSVPRSRSTAFERMVYERGDFICVHEPLSRVSDFGHSQVGDTTCRTQTDVVEALLRTSSTRPVFVKDTTDFAMTEALACLAKGRGRVRHTVMWRNPVSTVTSHLRLAPAAQESDIGYEHMLEVVRSVIDNGQTPFFLEGDDFADQPVEHYRQFCGTFGLQPHDDPATFRREPPVEWLDTARWHETAASSPAVSTSVSTGAALDQNLAERRDTLVDQVMPIYRELTALVRPLGRRG